MNNWFKKKKIHVTDDRYAVFSIYRYHNRRLEEIRKNIERIPIFQKQLDGLEEKLVELENDIMKDREKRSIPIVSETKKLRKKRRIVSNETSILFDRKYQLQTDITTLKKKIEYIESGREESEYNIESYKLLTVYYATRASMNEFERALSRNELDERIKPFAPDHRIAYQEKLADLTSKFLQKFFPEEYTEIVPDVKGKLKVVPKVDESLLSCYNWSYDQIRNLVRPIRHYNYKRINHFKEYLREQQGESKIFIPPQCLEDIIKEICKYTKEPNNASYALVKKVLKRLSSADSSYVKFYEHSKYITRLINKNYRPLSIEPEHECHLCQRFAETEAPFERHKKAVVKDRKNFMSYPFTAYKLAELAGYDQYLPSFKLLKSVTLLILQDKWWELICADLDWEPIRTVGRLI